MTIAAQMSCDFDMAMAIDYQEIPENQWATMTNLEKENEYQSEKHMQITSTQCKAFNAHIQSKEEKPLLTEASLLNLHNFKQQIITDTDKNAIKPELLNLDNQSKQMENKITTNTIDPI
jgi:hypothetical protein